MRRGVPGLLTIVYVGVGVAVAASHHHFRNADAVREVVSAGLAVFFWPLILLGIDPHIRK